MSKSKCGSLVFVVLLSLLMGIFSCVYIKNFMDQWVGATTPPEQRVLERTEILLNSVSIHVNEPMPTDIPSDIAVGGSQCWDKLQDVMQRNEFKYEIKIAIYGDGGTHIPGKNTGSVEALADVIFPDGTIIQLQYYAYRLVTCSEKQS